mmetsp:Transcript_1323/g.1592  ORF Transcript_1323/g.1592 Transcript_1323/m.1592 type:complete len:507 (+) Transcript_1323:274-1794(+)
MTEVAVDSGKILEAHASSTASEIASKVTKEKGFGETKDFRIALLGNVDSGKSTLCGVLSRGLLDDGRGMARSFVLRHQHELKRGQTSSVAMELLGFSNEKQVIPSCIQNATTHAKAKASHNKEFYEIASTAEHRCTLVDLCGHEKYLKTTIYGLTGMAPNCAMVIVGANHGIQRMTREHLGLCCALRVPFYVVVTKIDMCPENIFKETQMKVKRVLRKAGRKAYYVRELSHVNQGVSCIQAGNQFAPIFEVSSVTGQGLDMLRRFIKELTIRYSKTPSIKLAQGIDNEEEKANDADSEFKGSEYYLDDVYLVQGVGVVLGGAVRKGRFMVNDRLLVGPDRSGFYRLVLLKSIHRQCVPSQSVYEGQHGTFAVKSLGKNKEQLKRNQFRKGMVVVREKDMKLLKSNTVREFQAEIKVLHHSTTINPGYSPVVHLGVVRQAAVILSIKDKNGNECTARTGSEVIVRFRFVHAAEFLSLGRNLIFREGRAKGCGKITELYPSGQQLFQT